MKRRSVGVVNDLRPTAALFLYVFGVLVTVVAAGTMGAGPGPLPGLGEFACLSVAGAPFMVFAIHRKHLLLGAFWVFAPVLLWTVVAGQFASNGAGVLIGSAVVYAAMCLVCFLVLPDVRLRIPPWVCGQCGYDLRGVATPTCPECGSGFTPWPQNGGGGSSAPSPPQDAPIEF